MRAVRLRTEFLENPIGLGAKMPLLSWNCEGGVRQTAYEIVVRSSGRVLWESGKVESSSMYALYAGKPLSSRVRAEWTVRLYDEKDAAGELSSATFEMGIFAQDWTAKWIAGDYRAKKGERYPVDCFCKQFVTNKVASARLYVTAKGVYDVTLNSEKLDYFIFAPGITDYRKRIQYQTYDVTSLIRGQNLLELRLGDGWWRGCCAAYSAENVYGTQTSLMAQLELVYADGTRRTIVTDESWQWCNDGPVRFADLKDGEVYDARRHPSYSGMARVCKDRTRPVAADNVPVTEHEHLSPVACHTAHGKRVYDFGQNVAGYLSFRVKGKAGEKVRFICGEVLGSNGEVDLSGVQCRKPKKGWNQISLIKMLLGAQPQKDYYLTPKQEIECVCSGGEDDYKTSFAVFGFRYVSIEGEAEIENLQAIAVYSDMQPTGTFFCSEERINKLVHNTTWSMKGNFLDIPTDCPTRERLGWTGDAQIFFDTGAYLFDTSAFMRKWLRDMQDNQYENGLLSAVLPYEGVEMMYKATGSSVGWADAVYLIPYRYYLRYGDARILSDCWEMIRKYCDYLFAHTGMRDKKEARANPYNQYTYEKGVHLGEWLEPEEFRDRVYGTKARHPEECTAYLFYAMKTIGEIARILGEEEYVAKCKEYAEGAKKAYDFLFVQKGSLDTDRQAKLVRPLALGLLDENGVRWAAERLEKAVKKYNFRVGTGFLSTPFLLPVLTAAGKAETAYKVLENSKIPGWLAEVDAGATTVWEDWEGKLSQNHYSLGSVVGWLFDSCAGIRVTGENAFIIAPTPGGSLTHAEANYLSPYGRVFSRWERKGKKTVYTIEIPANTQAEIRLPNGETHIVTAGQYTFES